MCEWRGWSGVAKEAEAIDTACAIARGCKDGTYSKETSNNISVKRTLFTLIISLKYVLRQLELRKEKTLLVVFLAEKHSPH